MACATVGLHKVGDGWQVLRKRSTCLACLIYQGIHSNHAPTARFDIPMFLQAAISMSLLQCISKHGAQERECTYTRTHANTTPAPSPGFQRVKGVKTVLEKRCLTGHNIKAVRSENFEFSVTSALFGAAQSDDEDKRTPVTRTSASCRRPDRWPVKRLDGENGNSEIDSVDVAALQDFYTSLDGRNFGPFCHPGAPGGLCHTKMPFCAHSDQRSLCSIPVMTCISLEFV